MRKEPGNILFSGVKVSGDYEAPDVGPGKKKLGACEWGLHVFK